MGGGEEMYYKVDMRCQARPEQHQKNSAPGVLVLAYFKVISTFFSVQVPKQK